MFLSNSLISKSFLIVYFLYFLDLPLPLNVWIIFIWYTILITELTSFLSMFKPPKSIFHYLFYYKCYPNTLSDIVISNLILSSLTTHDPFKITCPTFCPVQHLRSCTCLLKFLLQFEQYFVSHKALEAFLHFNHPTWIQSFTPPSISLSFCITDPKYLNRVTCGKNMISSFHL